MIKFVTNIQSFWDEDLKNHIYSREVPFVNKNFNHLDKNYYDRGFLLQSFNEELPDSGRKFLLSIPTEIGSVSWTCISPNLILPTHKDSFYTLRKKENVELDECIRYLIFLQDHVFGQIAVFENKVISTWSKGDMWVFDSNEFHYAVNASNVPFHTCQVSTIK